MRNVILKSRQLGWATAQCLTAWDLHFAKAWRMFHDMYWHLLDDERRASYLLDMKDGLMPRGPERDTDIDQYPELPDEL